MNVEKSIMELEKVQAKSKAGEKWTKLEIKAIKKLGDMSRRIDRLTVGVS